jgi:hypothetical protein
MIELPSKYSFEALKAESAKLRALKAENAQLRAFVEELTNAEHHNPPVPLWIELKARALTEAK